MAWAKIDDKAPRHPKLLSVSFEARWLWLAALCYAQEFATDGVVPFTMLPSLIVGERGPIKRAEELIKAGLWERLDSGDFLIHDFLDWNLSRAQRELRKRNRSAAGEKGAAMRWNGTRHDTSNNTANGKSHGTCHEQIASEVLWQSDSRSESESEVKSESEEKDCVSSKRLSSGEFREAWNRLCVGNGIPLCRRMGAKRAKALKTRQAEYTDEEIEAALRAVKVSPFCRGANDRQWVASVDWFLRPEIITRLLEGHYANLGELTRSGPVKTPPADAGYTSTEKPSAEEAAKIQQARYRHAVSATPENGDAKLDWLKKCIADGITFESQIAAQQHFNQFTTAWHREHAENQEHTGP